MIHKKKITYIFKIGLYSNDFAGINFDSDEHCVVLNEMSFFDHLVRHETRETETKGIRFARRSLKVLPRWIGNETLDDIACFFRLNRLIEHGERNAVGKRPTQESVVFAR